MPEADELIGDDGDGLEAPDLGGDDEDGDGAEAAEAEAFVPRLAPAGPGHRRALLEFMLNPSSWVDESHSADLAGKIPEELMERYWRDPGLSPLIESELDLPPMAGDQSQRLDSAAARLLICDNSTLLDVMLFAGICPLSHSIVNMIDKRKLDAAREQLGGPAIDFARSRTAAACLDDALGKDGPRPEIAYSGQTREEVIRLGSGLLGIAAEGLDEPWRARVGYKLGKEAMPAGDGQPWRLDPAQAESLLLAIVARSFADAV